MTTLRLGCAFRRRGKCLTAALAGIALLCVTACERPVESPADTALRAMAPDGSRVIIGFPDALAPHIDTTAIAVTAADATLLTVATASIDSESATLLTAHVSPGYDLRAPVRIHLEGLAYERGTLVSAEPIDLTAPTGLRYERDMAPLFAARCNRCHDDMTPSGNYLTDTRADLYAFGSDADEFTRSRNLIPGNERCLLVVKTAFTGREFHRANLTAFESEMIRQWVLYGDAADYLPGNTAEGILAQPADFTHLRIAFARRPDPTAALHPESYRIVDRAAPDSALVPSDVQLDADLGLMAMLHVPAQKLFRNYVVAIGRMTDRYGSPIFDSARAEYRALLSYEVDIAPLLEHSCVRCHSPNVPDSARGYYRTDSYGALFAYGSDSSDASPRRNLVPTDSTCLLIVKTRQSGVKVGRCALRAPLTPLESHRIADWILAYFARQR